MSDLNLMPTEVEADLRATVRGLLDDRCPPSAVTAMYDGDRSLVDPLWQALGGELGLAGLLVPEELGGAGGTAIEAAAVLSELGRSVAPVPFLTSAVIATTALNADSSSLRERETTRQRDDESVWALLVPLSAGPTDALPVGAVADGRVSARVTSVAGALEADRLLVLADTGDGPALFAVSAADALVEPVVSLDMSRQLADVTVADAPGDLVVVAGVAAVQRALLVGAGLLASEQAGLARWCLEETLSYLKVRTQFGRVLGGFQALKHRLADLYADVEAATAAAGYAAAALAADDPEAEVAVRVAQSFCSEVACRAAEEAIQLHGGIGMTWEHPAHLYLKRAKAAQIALGTPAAHRAHLATLVNLPGVDR